jgi:hypothetical protein
MSHRGTLTALTCHLTKKVNKAEELTYLSTNIASEGEEILDTTRNAMHSLVLSLVYSC